MLPSTASYHEPNSSRRNAEGFGQRGVRLAATGVSLPDFPNATSVELCARVCLSGHCLVGLSHGENSLAVGGDVGPVISAQEVSDGFPFDTKLVRDGLVRNSTSQVERSHFGNLLGGELRASHPLATCSGLWVRTRTVRFSDSTGETTASDGIGDVVLGGSSVHVRRVAARRVVAGVQGERFAQVRSGAEEVGDSVGFQHSPTCFELAVPALKATGLPQPTLVRFPYVDLRPEAGNVRIGEGWQGLGGWHVEPPFLASLRQFYQKGGV